MGPIGPSTVMKQIDRYLFRQMAGPLLATLVVALLVLSIERGLRLLDTVLAAHGSIKLLAEMLAFLVPHYIGMALPLGLFLAVLLAFGRLARDNEMDVLHAAGISLFRLLRPVVIITLIALVVAFAVFDRLQPFGRYAYRAAAFNVKHAAIPALLQEGVFANVEGATVLVEEISSDRQRFKNVFVHEHTADGESRVIAAPYAQFDSRDPDRAPYVTFFLGTEMRLPADRAHSLEPAEVLSFETFSAPVGDEGMAAFRPRGDDERELTLIELWRQRKAPPAGIDAGELVAELHGRLVRIASVAVVPFLALPFALARTRTPQPLRIAAAVAILVAYNEILEVGKNLVEAGHAGPVVTLWLPCVVLGTACLVAVFVVALRPGLALTSWRASRPAAARREARA